MAAEATRFPDFTDTDELTMKGTAIDFTDTRNNCQHPNGFVDDQMIRDLELIERKLISKIVEKLSEIRRACYFSDVRGNGWMQIDQLRNILSVYCFEVKPEYFQKIMERWGFKASSLIGYLQFLQKFNKIKTAGVYALPYQSTHWYNPVRGDEVSIVEENGTELFTRLKKLIHNNYSTLKSSFLKFDEARKGYITWKELRRVLNKLSIIITDEQFTKVMKIIDPKKSGRISYHQFLNLFEERESAESHPWLKGSHIPQYAVPVPALDQSTVEKIIRNKIQDNWGSFTKAFLQIDLNQDGLISKNELAKLMSRYAIPMSEENFDKMWKKCDVNLDGDVDFYEFMERLGVDISANDLDGFSKRIHDDMAVKQEARKKRLAHLDDLENQRQDNCTAFKTVDEVLAFLKDFILQRSSDFRQTFLKFDSNDDGSFSVAGFSKFLKQLKINLKGEDFKELVSKFNFIDGNLQYRDFLTVFQDAKLCREQDLIRRSNHRYNQPIKGGKLPEEEVFKKMKQKICENSEVIFKAFKHAGRRGDHMLTQRNFLHIVNTFVLPTSRDQLESLFEYLELEMSHQIDFLNFLNKFQDVEDFAKGNPWLFTKYVFQDSRSPNNVSAEKAFQMLAQKAKDQWHSLAVAYRNFNRNGDGLIDEDELHEILKRFNIPVGPEEFVKLWNMFDADGDGSIDNDEFLNKLGTELAPGDEIGFSSKVTKANTIALQMHETGQRERNAAMLRNQKNSGKFITAAELKERLREKFRSGYDSFKRAFRSIDRNMDGFVSKEEFIQVLNYFHYYIEGAELDKLLISVGLHSSKDISYAEFIKAFGTSSKPDLRPLTAPAPTSSMSNLENEELARVLRRMIHENPILFEKICHSVDQENKGCLSKEKLHSVIKRSFMNLNKSQFQFFLAQLGLDNHDEIPSNLFLDVISKAERSFNNRCSVRPTSKDCLRQYSPLRRNSLRTSADRINLSLPFTGHSPRQNEIAMVRSYEEDETSKKIFMDDAQKRNNIEPLTPSTTTTTSVKENHDTTGEDLKLPELPKSPEKNNSHTGMIESMIRRNWQKIFKKCRKYSSYSDKMKIKTFREVLGDHNIYIEDSDIYSLMKMNCMEPSDVFRYTELLKRIVKKRIK